LLGTKEGIGHLPSAVIDPGDIVLVPDPGYPVYQSGTIFAGGEVHLMSLRAEHGWVPDFARIPQAVRRRAKLMFLNYPGNPTASCAPRSFFKQAVVFARENGILIAHDAAYAEIYFDQPPPSILEVDGGSEVCLEFHSLSKTFNMTGWRIGFAAGNAKALAALAKVKDNYDSGVFAAIQRAGAVALDSCCPACTVSVAWQPLQNAPPETRTSARSDASQSINAASPIELLEMEAVAATPDAPCAVQPIRDRYHRRRDALVPALSAAGWQVDVPSASFYVWARCPTGYDSMATASRILNDAHVVVIPGVGFGAAGDGYVRFALTVDESRTKEAAERIASIAW
jgi:LL-diaminopimelate aminotransferase